MLEKRGYHFETETDTEAVAVLCKYVWDSQPNKRLTFTTLIKAVIKEIVSPQPATHLSERRLACPGGPQLRRSLTLTPHSRFGCPQTAGGIVRVRVQVCSLPERDCARPTRIAPADWSQDRQEAQG